MVFSKASNGNKNYKNNKNKDYSHYANASQQFPARERHTGEDGQQRCRLTIEMSKPLGRPSPQKRRGSPRLLCSRQFYLHRVNTCYRIPASTASGALSGRGGNNKQIKLVGKKMWCNALIKYSPIGQKKKNKNKHKRK